ncbi:MAG: hypothetical protein ACREBB_06255 [Nitrosotalea sp.]
MSLTNREKTGILISQAVTLYSIRMQEDKIPKHQSVIDFILKNIPEQYKSGLNMELVDDVIAFVSSDNWNFHNAPNNIKDTT